MSSNLVVGITVGQRDLQVLLVDEQGRWRVAPPPRAGLGAVHRAWLDGSLPCRLWWSSSQSKQLREEESSHLVWHEKRLVVATTGWRFATVEEVTGQPAETGTLVLVPKILSESIESLAEELKQGTRLQRVWIFHTDRGGQGAFAEREPVAAGPLVQAWLRERFSQLDPQIFRLVACLAEGEQLLARDSQDNQRLNPQVGQRIDEAMLDAVREFPGSTLRLYAAGGMPQLSALMQTVGNFRFPKVQLRSPQEEPKSTGKTPPPPWTTDLSAHETYELRRRVRELIRNGETMAAMLLARPFRVQAQLWAVSLEMVGRFFQGYGNEARKYAEDYPGQKVAPILLELLQDHQPRCLSSAFRAEAALLAEDPISAISYTTTFWDIALFDAIDQNFRKDATKTCIDWQSRKLIREQSTIPTSHLDDEKPGMKARQVIELLRNNKVRASLPAVVDRLHSNLRHGNENPVNYRNFFQHSHPTERDIKDCENICQKRKIWLGIGRERSILRATTLPAQLLTELRVPNAKSRYDELIAALIADVEK